MGELILSKARELFFSYGLKSVSMDDLAKGAGISKKTIYACYGDKGELVMQVVKDLVQCHQRLIGETRARAKDPVDEVLLQSDQLLSTWAPVKGGFFHDLEKYFTGAWKKLEEHQKKVILPAIVQNLLEGKEQGLYRVDLDVPFTAELRQLQVSGLLQPSFMKSPLHSVVDQD